MKKIFLFALCCGVMMACGKGGKNADDKGNADAAWQVDMGGGESTSEQGGDATDPQNAEVKKEEPPVVIDAYQKQKLSDLTSQFCMLKSQLEKKQPAASNTEELKQQMSDIASEMRTRVEKLQDQLRAANRTHGEQWEDLLGYLRLVEGY